MSYRKQLHRNTSQKAAFEELDENKNMMAYGPARQYFIFLRMNLKPCL